MESHIDKILYKFFSQYKHNSYVDILELYYVKFYQTLKNKRIFISITNNVDLINIFIDGFCYDTSGLQKEIMMKKILLYFNNDIKRQYIVDFFDKNISSNFTYGMDFYQDSVGLDILGHNTQITSNQFLANGHGKSFKIYSHDFLDKEHYKIYNKISLNEFQSFFSSHKILFIFLENAMEGMSLDRYYLKNGEIRKSSKLYLNYSNGGYILDDKLIEIFIKLGFHYNTLIQFKGCFISSIASTGGKSIEIYFVVQ